MVAHRKQRRDFAGLANRRKQAARLFAKGETQGSVARQLKASRQSVSRWHRQWKSEGMAGLRAAGGGGGGDCERRPGGGESHGSTPASGGKWTRPCVKVLVSMASARTCGLCRG